MEREIKTTLSVDGTERFIRNLKSVDSELKVLGKELGTLTSKYAENTKSATSLAAQQANLQKQVSLNKQKTDALKAAVDTQRQAYDKEEKELQRLIKAHGMESKEVIEQAKVVRSSEIQLDSYRKKLADSELALQKSSYELKKFNEENGKTKVGQTFTAGKAAIDDFKKRVSEATEKFKPLTSAVKNVSKAAATVTFKAAEASAKAFAATVETSMKAAYSAVGKYGKTLAASATAAIGAVATGATVITKSIVSASSELAEYGDNIDKMSQKMGMSAETYQEWDAIMQHNGLTIDSMKSSMKTLATAAQKGNDAFAKIGITQEQIATMSQEDLFAATIAGLQKVDNETERTYLAGQLLGKGATELGALLNSSAEETEALRKKVHELGGIMSDEAVKASAKFADNLQDMKTAMSGIKRQAAAEFLPGMNSVMEGITKVYAGDEGGIAQFEEGVDQIADAIDSVSDKLIDMAEKSEPIIKAALNGIGKIVQKAVPIIIKKIPPLVAKILPDLIKTVGGLINQLSAYLGKTMPQFTKTVLPEAVKQIQSILPTLLNKLTTGFNSILLSSADMVVTTLPVVTQTILPAMIQGTTDLVVGMVGKLPELLHEVTAGAITLFQGLIDGLNAVMDELLPMLPQMVADITQQLFSSIPELFDGALELFGKLLEALNQTIQEIMPQLPQFITDMCKKLTDHIDEIIDAGFDLLISLIDGFTAATPTIMEELPKIVVKIAKKLTEPDNLGKLLQSGTDLIRAVAKGFPGAVKYIAENIPTIIKNIKDSLMSVDWLGLGIDIVKGILEGFLNVGEIIWDYVNSFKDELMDDIKDIFDIFSPSHLMRDEVGKYLGLGVVTGFVGAMEKGTEEMANSIPKEFDTDVKLNTAADLSYLRGYNGQAAGDVVYNIPVTVNFNGNLDSSRNYREIAEGIAQETQYQLANLGLRA